jgi:hypothetical protein
MVTASRDPRNGYSSNFVFWPKDFAASANGIGP